MGHGHAEEGGARAALGSLPEDDLARRMRAGDAAAFHELFRRVRDALQGFVDQSLASHLRSRVSVADILQEVHLLAFERRRGFEHRGPGSFRNWLYRIATLRVKQAVRHHVRAAKRALGREAGGDALRELAGVAEVQPSPSEAAIGGETARLVEEVLAVLPPAYREVLRLTREEHLSIQEAAEIMGRQYQATRKLLARALARFGEEMERRRRPPR